MEIKLDIILFGDQTNSFEDALRQLLRSKDNSAVTTLLERVNLALRLEIGGLPISQQHAFPRFTSILDLLARYRQSGKSPALESVFHCLNQLGWFVYHFSNGAELYPVAKNTRIVGICTGLLAAAAVSTCHTLAELIPAAVDAVLIAFRVGLRTENMSNAIVKKEDSSRSWSAVVGMHEAEAASAIEIFLKDRNIPPLSKTYISAVATNSVTITGPPSTLDDMLRSEAFVTQKAAKTTVYAPYHARHMYNGFDVDTILSASSSNINRRFVDAIPILSNVSSFVSHNSDYRSILRTVLSEILAEPIRWDRLVDSLATELKSNGTTHHVILPFGNNSAQSLASSLSLLGIPSVKVTEDICDQKRQSDMDKSIGRSEQSKIAIIGYSGRYPDAASNEKFWQILHEGRDVHREIPADRFDAKAHFDPTGKRKNTSRVAHGCFIEEPGLFDERFFNMSPREAANSDPGQRLAITTAYEAMEMAGFVTGRTPSTQKDRVGIFYGMTSDDWREVNSGQNIDTYFIPGGNRAFTPGRLNYFFKFSGPSFSIDTACSSSFAAIHTACNSLWRGDCDTAFAGGTNVMTNPDNFAGLDRGHFLSTTGNCNTFDDGADGYCRADGVGTIILKRLEDAQADGDPIQGVLLGAYTNHSADAESMTRPHVGAQAFIFEKMLNMGGVSPLDVSYIEMHGTGTQAGDATEMGSVLKVFASGPGKRPSKPLYLGSTKSNIGHAESSSGVLSLIKVLMMMQNNEIPPHCGIKTRINSKFPTDLNERNVHIASKPVNWPRPKGGVRRTFLNNFSAAGGNTALLLEDAPLNALAAEVRDPRGHYIVAVSGKSASAFKKNAAALAHFLSLSPGISLPALSYTTTARRIHQNFRATVTGSDVSSIVQQLNDLERLETPRAIPAKAGQVAFIFTGQGAMQLGMGKHLFENVAQFRTEVQSLDRIAQRQGFPSFLNLIDGSCEDVESVNPVIAQLGTTCLQMALTKLWISWGVSPDLVVGHSLGEYAGLHAAGILSASDTIFLTGTRAQLMVSSCTTGTHSMLAAKISLEDFNDQFPSTNCEVACINAPSEIVLSGLNLDIDKLSTKLALAGKKRTKLLVPFAFHSSQVEPILSAFDAAASGVLFAKPAVPYMSPLLREIVTDHGIIEASYLGRACRGTVDFLGAVSATKNPDKITWIEIGSHPVCCGLLEQIFGSGIGAYPSLHRAEDAWKTMSNTISQLHSHGTANVDWNEYHRDFKSSQQVLRLPLYQWDSKNHWIQYRNNFTLTKGDLSSIEIPTVKTPISIYTSAVQHFVEQRLEGPSPEVVIQSDLSEPGLASVVWSHRVNGIALCPSSLYADIALTLGDYLLGHSKIRPCRAQRMDVAEMVVSNPLIATGDSQLFRASAKADWSSKTISISYYSVSTDGKKIVDHAHCIVRIGDGEEWLKDWKRSTYLIQSRIDTLRNGVDNGVIHKLKRKMAYKLFSAVVEYDTKYQGMEEVLLDSDNHEASAKVSFQTSEADGKFHFSPFWIDSLGHLAGFVMNGNDAVDSQVQVFVNHGWDSMRCAQDFSADKTYRTYVKMQNVGGTMYSGDVYIIDEGVVVGLYQGVKFQGIPRKVLNSLLPSSGAAKKNKVPLRAIKDRPSVTKQTGAVKAVEKDLGTVILALIAEEIGVEVSNLTPNTSFDDIGVDSLLALNITSRLREELYLEVESSLFIDYPTVKTLLGKLSGGTANSKKTTITPLVQPACSSATDILGLIAEETGVEQSDLTPSVSFDDIGLDSLLALNIIGRLREDLQLEVGNSLFTDYPTVRELLAHLNPLVTAKTATTDGDSEFASTSSTTDTAFSTPPSDTDYAPSYARSDSNITTAIRNLLAQEIGVDVSEIKGSTDLGELGLDSLLSLTVLSEMREMVDVELPSDLFSKHSTLDAIQSYLGLTELPVSLVTVSAKLVEAMPAATSVLLQGSPKTCSKRLFLFPDGSGSSTSYAPLPSLGNDIAVFGLNCPYMRKPKDMKCTLAELTFPYLNEIRRRQPHGPYYLGGWSAGGICAYDAAQQLTQTGEEVARLILLDSPFPVGLEKLPPRLYDFFDSIDLFGQDRHAPPSWLLEHFLAFIDALDTYEAVPLKSKIKTFLVWAEDGVCNKPDSPRPEMCPDDPKEMTWLLNNRKDFGPNGWDGLVGKNNLVIKSIKGANHFTMMKGDKARELSEFMRLAMV